MIDTWISQAPTLSQLEDQAERLGLPISVIIRQEAEKFYIAIHKAGTKQEKKVLRQNPALMTYQSLRQRHQPQNKVYITEGLTREYMDGEQKTVIKSKKSWPSEMNL